MGLVPLVHCRDTDYAVFLDAPTLQKPLRYDTAVLDSMAHDLAQLQVTLAQNQFISVLLAFIRDAARSGSFESLSAELNLWIQRYVGVDEAEVQAWTPLRSAEVAIVPTPDDSERCVMRVTLEPRFATRRTGPIAREIELRADRHKTGMK